MVREDYILNFNHPDFYNSSIRNPGFSTDHLMVLSNIRGCSERRIIRYRRGGILVAHCSTKEGSNARGIHGLHRSPK